VPFNKMQNNFSTCHFPYFNYKAWHWQLYINRKTLFIKLMGHNVKKTNIFHRVINIYVDMSSRVDELHNLMFYILTYL